MKKLTTEEFIKKAICKHGYKFDYSHTKYINNRTGIFIKCSCGQIFKQTPSDHLQGYGCPYCGGTFPLNTEQFIRRAKQKHGEIFDYSLTNYQSFKEKISIICKIHGAFFQLPPKHLSGQGCPSCRYQKMAKTRIFTFSEFLRRTKQIHQNKFDYSKSNYIDTKNKIDIICHKHGIFSQRPADHLKGQGCPRCNLSHGENSIINFLKKRNVLYIHQKSFPNCINPLSKRKNGKLKFDFYIPSNNLLIEYDGPQHFHSNCLVGGKHRTSDIEWKELQYRDKIKSEYADKNNIPLLRINYKQFKNINKILHGNLSH